MRDRLLGLGRLLSTGGLSAVFREEPHRSDRRRRLETPGTFYGGTGTIHRTGEVNVEVDRNGEVVSVWYRCAMLPFTQTVVGDGRAKEMRGASGPVNDGTRRITGIVFDDVQ